MIKNFFLIGTILLLGLAWGCADRFTLKDRPGSGGKPGATETAAEKVKKPRYPKPTAPDISSETELAGPDAIETALTQAREYMAKKAYEEVLPLTESLLAAKPSPSVYEEAFELTHAAYYHMGQRLHQQRRYIEAIDMLKKVSPSYRDTKDMLAAIRVEMKQQADIHYKQGVKYFINEDLTRAIAEWQQVLLLEPDHPKASEDIQNARELLEKLEKIE